MAPWSKLMAFTKKVSVIVLAHLSTYTYSLARTQTHAPSYMRTRASITYIGRTHSVTIPNSKQAITSWHKELGNFSRSALAGHFVRAFFFRLFFSLFVMALSWICISLTHWLPLLSPVTLFSCVCIYCSLFFLLLMLPLWVSRFDVYV